MIPGVRRSTAWLSHCGTYRYRLDRELDVDVEVEVVRPARVTIDTRVTFLMLNPSTADDQVNDPTVAKCCKYAATWGYRHLCVVNLFALRSTDPEFLYSHHEPIGQSNDRAISDALWASDMVVCAWGTHGAHLDRGRQIARQIVQTGPEAVARLHVLKLCKDGQPGHPLYLRDSLRPRPWVEVNGFAAAEPAQSRRKGGAE